MEAIHKYRQFLKNDDWEKWEILNRDQKLGAPPPARQTPPALAAPLIDLISPDVISVGSMPLIEAIAMRRSHRDFSALPLTLEELSFLLWATQGVQRSGETGGLMLRTVPSAGARHPFESYLLIRMVEGLQPGLYRYLALDHKLCFLGPLEGAAMEPVWPLISTDPLIFVWTVVPYRMEWRYSILSHKMIAIEAGHICQNLYLAATAIGAGVCAIGAFKQTDFDTLLGLDGVEQFTVYVARLGKLPAG